MQKPIKSLPSTQRPPTEKRPLRQSVQISTSGHTSDYNVSTGYLPCGQENSGETAVYAKAKHTSSKHKTTDPKIHSPKFGKK